MENLEDLFQKHNIKYENKDSYYLISCINPNHEDKNPSMGIQKEYPHLYNCFSCGESGNIHTFIKKLTGKYPRENLNNYTFLKKKKEVARKRKIIKKVNTIEGTFISCYKSKLALDYLRKRDISNEFIDFFNLKYCHSVKINGTTYKNRICIPIYQNKKLVNIEGRSIDRETKPKVLYCKGGSVNTLFNIDNINKNKTIYIVEGIWGLASVWQYASKNVVATFGKSLSKKQKEIIKKLPHICIIPDNDLPKENTILNTFREYEKFYDNEFYISCIKKQGSDPNDLNRDQLLELISLKETSTDFIMAKYGLGKKRLVW